MTCNYDNVENLGAFGSPEALQAYRDMLLEKTEPQANFIAKHVWEPLGKHPLSMVEVGSGNGRLLISLALKSVLADGWGIDISESRTNFAKNWVADLGGLDELRFIHGDILPVCMMAGAAFGAKVDLAVCITGCFQYFYPIAPEAPRNVLNFMRRSAKYSLFELYKRPPMGKTWHKLHPADPWAYLLDEYIDGPDWVTHNKTFIGRNGEVDERSEDLGYYTMNAFHKHLHDAGYKKILWSKEDDSVMVVLCQS